MIKKHGRVEIEGEAAPTYPYAIAHHFEPGVDPLQDVEDSTLADRSFSARLRNVGFATGVNVSVFGVGVVA